MIRPRCHEYHRLPASCSSPPTDAETFATHPAPAQETLLVLHLNRFLLLGTQLFEEPFAFLHYVRDELLWQPRLGKVQEAYVEKGVAQVGEEGGFRGGVQGAREGEDGDV